MKRMQLSSRPRSWGMSLSCSQHESEFFISNQMRVEDRLGMLGDVFVVLGFWLNL